jgi:serine/threonine protein kinase
MQNRTVRCCAGCMTAMSEQGRCSNSSCQWDEATQPETQEHLPRHYVLLDRYYIGRVLGQGGFGVTYIAQDLKLDRVVAIKEFLPRDQCSRRTDRVTVHSHSAEKGEEFRYGLERFLNEAQNIAKLGGHPNIVSVSDYAEANGTAYVVMEFISGVTLKQYLAGQGGKIPYPVATEIVMHVMSGLNKAHEHGLVHRDVSPDNIMISSLGPVKLIDFGAARQAVGERSQNLTMVLKPGYAPEEQYRSRGVQGPWTDVYATAATLYRCITGQVPPPAPDRLAEDELIRPSVLCPGLPLPIEAALLRGLSVRAADRARSIHEFRDALLHAKGGVAEKPLPNAGDIRTPRNAAPNAGTAQDKASNSARNQRADDLPLSKPGGQPAASAVASRPSQGRNTRLYVFLLLVGLAIFGVSFALRAVGSAGTSDSKPYLGWFCANWTTRVALAIIAKHGVITSSDSLETYAAGFSGLINPVFLLALLLRIWKRTRKPALVLTLVLVPLHASCWIVFNQYHLVPLEGYFLWVGGMLTVSLASPLSRWLGR